MISIIWFFFVVWVMELCVKNLNCFLPLQNHFSIFSLLKLKNSLGINIFRVINLTILESFIHHFIWFLGHLKGCFASNILIFGVLLIIIRTSINQSNSGNFSWIYNTHIMGESGAQRISRKCHRLRVDVKGWQMGQHFYYFLYYL